MYRTMLYRKTMAEANVICNGKKTLFFALLQLVLCHEPQLYKRECLSIGPLVRGYVISCYWRAETMTDGGRRNGEET